jgi:hypothetical protein
MVLDLKNYEPALMLGAQITENGDVDVGNLSVSGTSALTGAATFTALATFNGGAALSGVTTGFQSSVVKSAAVGATVQLTAAQSGAILINASTSGSPSWTLPANAASGIEFTFICGNTTAGFTVTSASQVIHFKTSASGTVLTSTTTLTNTQASAIVGDFISIVSDGTAWWMTGISGIFAAS